MSTQLPPTDPLATSGLVIVDKPAGMTSHDVVARLRRIYRTRKVGHAGTLDPMATGVLVAGIERGTKFLAHMVASTKAYDATIRLGAATSTDDREGEIRHAADAAQLAQLSDADIIDATGALRGDIMQRPAAVSAIKIGGRRAHEIHRAGETVELAPRPVTIYAFDIHSIDRVEQPPAIDIRASIRCSSGTYIRALARDLGADLGVGGHLTELRRTEVGPFGLNEARTVAELADAAEQGQAPLSLSLDEALTRCYPTIALTESEAAALAMGQWLEPRGLKGVHAAVAPNGQAIALVKESGKRLAVSFVARPSTL